MKAFGTLALAAGASAIVDSNDLKFMNFMAVHGKSYESVQEFNHRLARFTIIDDLINEETAKNLSYKVGHNKFSDWTAAERSSMLGYLPTHTEAEMEAHSTEFDVQTLPVTVNWVTDGAVNRVQDQGQCGSCWAFSSCAAMEGIDQITNGTLRKFSEQQLVDCVTLCFGCNGGNFNTVFGRYAETNAMYAAARWPYTGTDGNCSDDTPVLAATDFKTSGLVTVTANNQEALKTQLSHQPVSVAIQADQLVFQQYKAGVFDDPRCGTALDHAVTLVGYGVEGGQGYYLMRNSWGSSWGEAGYMKMAMTGNDAGTCGVQMDPVAPTTVKI